jgi:hypothetical protein
MSTKSIIKPEVIIDKVSQIPIGTLASYRPEQLHELLQAAQLELERAKMTKQWLESAIALKYEEKAKAKRLRWSKDSGVVHLEEDGFKISCDVVKKVEWDQQKLAKIAADIMTSGGSLDDYVEIHYNVSERNYNSWSESLRNIFNPARTVKLGKASYKLVKPERGNEL